MRFNYFPNIIHFDITKRCNLKCTHCRNNLTSSDEIDIKFILSFFDKIFFLSNNKNTIHLVEIGGGEPLLSKKLFDLLDYLKSRVGDVLITTNGILIDSALIRKFLEYKNLRFQISLDGATKKIHETIRGKNSFFRAINSIKLLKENGFYVSIRMTISKSNYFELENFIKLAKSLHVDEVSYRGIMPCGRALSNYDSKLIEPDQYRKILLNIPKMEKRHKIKIFCGDPLALIFRNEKKDQYGGCSIGICYLFMDEQGNIKPCPSINVILKNISDFKTPSDFWKFWVSNDFYGRIRNRSFTKCANCCYKYLCGGCRAFAFYDSGDYFGEDGHCFLK